MSGRSAHGFLREVSVAGRAVREATYQAPVTDEKENCAGLEEGSERSPSEAAARRRDVRVDGSIRALRRLGALGDEFAEALLVGVEAVVDPLHLGLRVLDDLQLGRAFLLVVGAARA